MTSRSEREFENADRSDFQENSNGIGEILKVFLHSPPPWVGELHENYRIYDTSNISFVNPKMRL